jgi:hypothetical protein
MLAHFVHRRVVGLDFAVRNSDRGVDLSTANSPKIATQGFAL